MFKYSRDRDRFVPDRSRELYSFRSVDRNYALDHRCVSVSPGDCDESGFLEPFECERRNEQQHRKYRQLEAYMSPELNGRHLLRTLCATADDENEYKKKIAIAASDDASWPVRMVQQRSLARKSNINNSTYAADMLLDMPNLSGCWRSKILDWSSTGYLTAAIESSIHLWSCRSQSVQYTVNVILEDEPVDTAATKYTDIICLKWDVRGEILAYSFTVDMCSCSMHADEPPDEWSYLSNLTAEPSIMVTVNSDDEPSSAVTINRDDTMVNERSLNGSASFSGTPENSFDYSSSTLTTDQMGGYIKVWLLNGQKDGSNYEQKTSKCSCSSSNPGLYQNISCCVTDMDWFANGRVLVTGCSRVTITFFNYDHRQKQLIALSTINGLSDLDPDASITCLYTSLDRPSRHVAVSTLSSHASVLTVWRIDNPLEHGHLLGQNRPVSTAINVHKTLTDRYDNSYYRAYWFIKACAWHPWKHSLICYAVTTMEQTSDGNPSWIVLANACNGEVLKRVEQTSCYSNCLSVKILSVVTHSMTFSRITGELLVSATRAYRVQKNGNFSITKKHSVVVMHALNRIVETLNSNTVARGLFFTWNPDGTQIAMTCSDQSLRIWNFWPTSATQRKTSDYRLRQTDSAQYSSHSLLDPEDRLDNINASRERNRHNNNNNNNYCYQNNHIPSMMSELSLAASRVIK